MDEGTQELRNAWVIIPAVMLLVVGGSIAVFSGSGRLGAGSRFRPLLDNFVRMLFRVAGYVVALLVLQYMAGQRPMLGW